VREPRRSSARKAKPFDLRFQERAIQLTQAGTLQTGAAEEGRVYLSLNDFEAWTGVAPTTIEVAGIWFASRSQHAGQPTCPSGARRGSPPVRQIMESEAQVLGKTRATLLAAAILIILTASVCVLATLMGWVFDRRRDFCDYEGLGSF